MACPSFVSRFLKFSLFQNVVFSINSHDFTLKIASELIDYSTMAWFRNGKYNNYRQPVTIVFECDNVCTSTPSHDCCMVSCLKG